MSKWRTSTITFASLFAAGSLWVCSKYAFSAYRSLTPEELGLDEFESLHQVGKLKLNRYLRIHPTNTDICYIVVHGFGGQMLSLAPVINLLADFGSVFAVDHVGHGKSQTSTDPLDYSTEAIVESIASTFKSSCPQFKTVVVIGHSLGCAHSVRLSNILQESGVNVKGIVLVSPKSTEEDLPMLKKMVQRVSPIAIDFIRFVESFAGAYSTSVNRIVHKNDLTLRHRSCRWNRATPSSVIRLTALGIHLPEPKDYESIRAPLLMLYGIHDTLTKYDPNVTNIEKWAKNSQISIHELDSSHLPMWEDNDNFNRHLLAFLKDIKAVV
ncbi:hypothetical protein BATDEDRAFT_21237 [Batrachochytrium dendrobatidis JAM81]|uniref:AB hydrolase-1 domain-containing protein n=1 Tax=Batrachochytrium dendrobatidis (strain JAM81 / FGSC 10211) TaxID=684364 RepID=F4NRX1_BATDJ|nr:uncharacterized protein BATDEDRAFT_21237 [Batrachochytrium dendrobatidis JAM81]EGF82970.1 hypothetical protein BATDEDRAFT_21237 [Batrachochytrium dendrobatidis JAM81]KAJ8331660.1 hypothetical protein O5D80_000562 [Batrachochytrium dendrobatidis]|eukprot:XP_006675233.1 hypothetical protein BATDEDRAFT_21237 [Batrachochytrium dendrobatidis JAM81]